MDEWGGWTAMSSPILISSERLSYRTSNSTWFHEISAFPNKSCAETSNPASKLVGKLVGKLVSKLVCKLVGKLVGST